MLSPPAPLSSEPPADLSPAAAATGPHRLSLSINGQARQFEIASWVSLLDLLREHAGLTGTKKGCDHGQCGACTVLVDGRRINACLSLAVMQQGREVVTVEGLGAPVDSTGTMDSSAMHPLQRAFVEQDALQCGYCTPGQICSAAGLLMEHPCANDAELRERMSGNLCRCGAYPQITRAVAQVLFASRPSAEAVATASGGAAS